MKTGLRTSYKYERQDFLEDQGNLQLMYFLLKIGLSNTYLDNLKII
jgi:hypothetical protein